MKNVLFSLLSILLLASCNGVKQSDDKSLLPKSSGKYGEVLIVVDTIYENRQTGDALREIFEQELLGLPQQESQFRASTVPPRGFQSILKRSKNVLKLSIGQNKKTAINVENDVWAKDQLLIQITAGSDEDAARILRKNITTIRAYFNEKELERLQKQFSIKPQKELIKKIEEKAKIHLTIPPGYVEMSKDSTGFWLKKEKQMGEHQVLQGISVFWEPYSAKTQFELEEVVDSRNGFTAEHIQGTRDSSFMKVYNVFNPAIQEINLNGMFAKEFRGLWNMENDFMGGPFLHYIFVDESTNRLIHLDGFVFAPQFDKREYVRELEAILKTVKTVSTSPK